MDKINFQNGTLVSKAKVTVGGTVYEVEPEEYEGETPLSAEILNEMQDNIENAINTVQSNLNTTNQSIENLTTYSASEEIKTGEKWIDGKPFYRRTFSVTLPSRSNYELDISNLNIEKAFFDCNHSYFHDRTNERYYPISVANVSVEATDRNAVASVQATMYFNNQYTKLIVEGGGAFTWSVMITITYTKTTD